MTTFASVTVSFRDAETGKIKERAVSVEDRSYRTDDELASDAVWIVQLWRGVDRDSVKSVMVERSGDLLAKYEAQRAARAGVGL
jgi:hypothetical protein